MKKRRSGQADGANAAAEARAAENKVEANRLRLQGYTYREIASILEVSVSTVHGYIMAVRDELSAAAHELAALVRDEEDAVLLGCKRRLLARLEALDKSQPEEAGAGDAKEKKATDGALINLTEALRKNSESRRALWGADAPPAILAEVEGHAMTFLQAAGSESDLERIAAGGVTALQVLAAGATTIAARLRAAEAETHEARGDSAGQGGG